MSPPNSGRSNILSLVDSSTTLQEAKDLRDMLNLLNPGKPAARLADIYDMLLESEEANDDKASDGEESIKLHS